MSLSPVNKRQRVEEAQPDDKEELPDSQPPDDELTPFMQGILRRFLERHLRYHDVEHNHGVLDRYEALRRDLIQIEKEKYGHEPGADDGEGGKQ